jgi:hypothetical protein
VPVALFPSSASFPCISARSASTSSFSRPAQRLLALQPAHSRSHLMTLYIEGISRVVTFPTAPIATGRSDPCREGLAPSQEPYLSTAHAYKALFGDRGFLHRSSVDDRTSLPVGLARLQRDLTPASGCRDHTSSPSASMPLVSHAFSITHEFDLALQPHAHTTSSRPPHPAPRFVTIGINAPLHRGGMGKFIKVICPTG